MADQNIYLVARYLAKPANPRLTSRAGYMSDPANIEYDEEMFIARGYKSRYLQWGVVLNISEEKIIKNNFKKDNSFKELFDYYYEGYKDYIDESVAKLNEISNNRTS